ncbi:MULTISPECIES: flavin reductase family protein [unclassified Ruegeria]|uniref:flavin reductase family protein n=1 Tax=unclassified Ruegeria TaxID=2625375 RepID=UPI001ADB7725|nr:MULTISPECIES: flavin reductase family protein [unclassified Ruegeria]MBO9412696.1 flavin reductase family protein [Ruegeria sp. R8_1]MBO9416756.1 flavin reductase family protein [Ruegeria sp. R8_2]
MTLDPRALRDAFGSFMTGVTVITARDAIGQPVGFTANSFSSVSLDPPLLLVCPGKFLSSYEVFAGCSHFAVNILAEGQQDVSNTFASYKGDRFAKVAHSTGAHDLPLIDGALAQFCCSTHQAIPAGDHTVLIGQVTDFSHAGGRGLGYVGGSYFSLGLEQEMDSDQPTICGAIIRAGDAVLMERLGTTHSPFHIAGAAPGGQRLRLAQGLADRGIEAQLEQVYSSFNDATTKLHYTFFLASSAGTAAPDGTEWIAIEHLPKLTYATPSVGHMMTRFALEAREGNFSLYLGDADRGELHSFDKGAG